MAETIKVACPGCDAIFEIPIELEGELGECTECGVVFEIPKIEAGKRDEKVKPIIPEMSDEDIEATGTVKLSRSSIGMIPELKDAFDFGVTDDDKAAELSNMISNTTLPAQPAPPKEKPKLHINRPTPQPQPKPAPQPASPTPQPRVEPKAEGEAHGGLHIAKPKEKSQDELDKDVVIFEDKLSSREQMTALILCLVTGWCGVHRFYVGKYVTGVVMMLTLGGLGIWWFIDLLIIVTDKFTDADNLPLR